MACSLWTADMIISIGAIAIIVLPILYALACYRSRPHCLHCRDMGSCRHCQNYSDREDPENA